MVITAKFQTKCTACEGRIFKGDRINWTRGVKGVSHTNCDQVEHREPEAEPENFEFKGPKAGTVQVGFDLPSMTPAQLKALRDIVEAELTKRETPAQAA
jgi:hypothetical protein